MRLCGLLLIFSLLPAQDLTKLEGRFLHPAGAEDVRGLALLLPALQFDRYPDPEKLPAPARQLRPALQAAYRAQNVNDAWRLSTRLTVVLLGERWSDAHEVLTSYQFTLDRRIVEPGDPLAAALEPTFVLERPLEEDYRARLTLRSADNKLGRLLAGESLREFNPVHSGIPTAGLADGEYFVRYELSDSNGGSVITAERSFLVRKGLRARLARLGALVERTPKAPAPPGAAALASAEYFKLSVERALKEYYASIRLRAHPFAAKIPGIETVAGYFGEPFSLDDFPRIEKMLAAAAGGKDPLRALRGDLRLAYRSAVDNTLQPYRLYVPAKTNGPRPLVVALHGATGDENTYFGAFGGGLLAKLGDARGWLVVAPAGRGPFGGYAGNSEQDVLDVMDTVARLFPVDTRQVFLTGHSMGAMGTWSLGFRHAARFAALAPVAGANNVTASLLDQAPHLPVLLVQGGKDALTVPAAARAASELAKTKLKFFEYREWPDADHFTIGAVSLPAVFDFFARVPPRPQ